MESKSSSTLRPDILREFVSVELEYEAEILHFGWVRAIVDAVAFEQTL